MALKDTSSIESIQGGVDLTLKQLVGVFDKFQLVEINRWAKNSIRTSIRPSVWCRPMLSRIPSST